MNRLSIMLVLIVVTSQICTSVILRPGWFPYFRPPNQTAQRLRYSSEKAPEMLDLRQTRDAGNSNADKRGTNDLNSKMMDDIPENPCKSGISVVGCLIRVLNIVNHAIEQQGFPTK